MTSIARNGEDRLLIAVASIALTAVVVARQIGAFHEIGLLLARLDSGMLELRRTERRFRLLAQSATDVVLISEPNGTISYVSPSVLRILGHKPADLLQSVFLPLIHPDDRDLVSSQLAVVATHIGDTTTYQARVAHADGLWRWMEVTSTNLIDEPSVACIVHNSRDVTETRVVQERLRYEATHDVLTGLANRALFAERLEHAVSRPGPDSRFAVVLVDLDDFKVVNDTLGHAAGDTLLVEVAQRMRDGARPGDTVARLRG